METDPSMAIFDSIESRLLNRITYPSVRTRNERNVHTNIPLRETFLPDRVNSISILVDRWINKFAQFRPFLLFFFLILIQELGYPILGGGFLSVSENKIFYHPTV